MRNCVVNGVVKMLLKEAAKKNRHQTVRYNINVIADARVGCNKNYVIKLSIASAIFWK